MTTTNPKSITVEVRNVYGNEMVYPACDTSKLFARIANRTTLNASILNDIAQLGYQVKTASTPLPFTIKQVQTS
jgi:hypothetical protein